MQSILLIDDDQELCELLDDYLTQEGFLVDTVNSGAIAAEYIASKEYTLLILDVMLPGKNGFEVLRETRSKKQVPILMLTAKGDEIDRIVGLELGADDYLAKPCNPRELVARIRSIIRRYQTVPAPQDASSEQDIVINDLCVSITRRQVLIDGEEIDLTATEFQILILLVKTAGELVTRELISEQCLGRKLLAFDRSIDMHISHLRKKLGLTINSSERIKTVRGTGYQYVAV